MTEAPGLERSDILDRARPLLGRHPAASTLASLLAERFSCRAFRPDPVPTDVVERLVSLAQLAASWCNVQPWQVIVTSGAGTERFRQALLDAAHAPDDDGPDIPFPEGYEGVYRQRRRETAWRLYESVGVEWGDREASAAQSLQNFRLFGAPHALILTTDRKLGTYGAIDCGVFLANFLLLAQSAGVATIPQAALAARSGFIHRYFDLPENRLVVCGVSFGYADENHPANGFRTSRTAVEEALRWVLT